MKIKILKLFDFNIPEGNFRQILYALGFTILVHLIMTLLIISNINWKIKPKNDKTIDVLFVNVDGNLVTENPPPQTKPQDQQSPKIENKPAPKIRYTPPALPIKPEVKPIPKAEPNPEPKPKTELKNETKPEQKPKTEAKPETKEVAKNENKKEEIKEENFVGTDLLNELINRSTENIKTTSQVTTTSQDLDKIIESTGRTNTTKTQSNTLSATQLDGYRKIYVEDIKSAIRPKVILPSEISANPVVEVLIEQDEKGNIIKTEIIKSSGNNAFDEAVIRAIKAASPLPLPNKKEIFDTKIILKWSKTS